MNKKLLPLLLNVLAAAGGVANAQTPAPAAASSVAVTATASVVSDYMFRGLRLSSGGLQPAVEMTSGNLTLGAWSNWPFDGQKVPDSSDPEIDLYGSYTVALGENSSLAPGFTLYWFPDAPTSLGFYKTTFEPNLAFNYTFEGVKLTPKVYYDAVLKGPTYEFTAAYAVPLKELGTEVSLVGTVGTYKWTDFANKSTPATKAWGDYWLVGISLPFALAANQKVTLGFAYTEGRRAFTKQGNAPKAINTLALGRGVASLSYSYSF